VFARGEMCMVAATQLVRNIVHNYKMISNNILKWFKHKIVNKFSGCSLGKNSGSAPSYTDIQRKQIMELELFIF
jgi:hypothetical protein